MAITGEFPTSLTPAIGAAAIGKGIVVKRTTDASDGSFRVDVCGTSDVPFGVAFEAIASGGSGAVCTAGICYVQNNGAFSIGDKLTVAASDGQVDTLAADGETVGIALHAASSTAGEYIPVLLRFGYDTSPA